MSIAQVLSWGNSLKRVTCTRHKDLILRLVHGELYSKERLHRYRLIDSPDCSRCGAIETLCHKYIECPYARQIWTKAFAITDSLKTLPDSNEPLINRIICSTAPDPLAMIIHAEIILRIKGLKDDQNYLIRPKILVKSALKLLNKRELNEAHKEAIAQLVLDCD